MEGKDRLDQITRKIIGAAIEVHKAVGPGLFESAYQACLAFELQNALQVAEQVPLPLLYKEVKLDCGYRIDLLVEDSIIVEIKRWSNFLRSTMHSFFRISGWLIRGWAC